MSLFKKRSTANDSVVPLNSTTDFSKGITPFEPERINFADFGITSKSNIDLILSAKIDDNAIDYRETLIYVVAELYKQRMETYKHDAEYTKGYINNGIDSQIARVCRKKTRLEKMKYKEVNGDDKQRA